MTLMVVMVVKVVMMVMVAQTWEVALWMILTCGTMMWMQKVMIAS